MAGRTGPRVLIAGVLAAALVLGAGSCSGGPDDDATPGTTSLTAASPSTTAATTAPPTTTRVPAAGTVPFISEPPSDTATTGPEGSGCAPTSPTSLPDGVWFGSVRTVDIEVDVMGLDLACLYFHDAANAAAAADGATEVPVPDDYWIEDRSTNVYRLRLVPDVAVGVVPERIVDGAVLAPGGSGAGAVSALEGRRVWVQVVDGWVVAVQQQYFP